MIFTIRPHHFPWSIVGLGASLFLLGTGLGLHGMTSTDSRPSTDPTLSTTGGPRLILPRHTVPFAGTIDGGIVCYGTLSPSLPGVNTITLSLRPPGRLAARGGLVSLVLSMPGMAMRPVKATLIASSEGYRGSAILPMFGRYRAQVDASTADGRYTGALSLTLPLTLSHG
jgi:hypothetical protein